MPTLLDNMQVELAQLLQRRSINRASRWGENYIVLGKPIPGPMRYTHHPWSREWCDYTGSWVGRKAAQMAMTQSALTRALYNVDILRNDVLYILPKKTPDATDFSKGKFDILLELSPHIRGMFSNVKNVGHKQAGNVNLFFRGSRSRSGLKSISVGLKIFDEFDEMFFANIALAEERSSGYKEEDIQQIKLSTPTLPDIGISKEFTDTTQDHYFFKCPRCNRFEELFFPESLVIPTDDPKDLTALKRSHLICTQCKKPLPENKASYINEANCEWRSTISESTASLRGFEINGLYSLVRPLHEIAKKVILGRTDDIVAKEVHNSIAAKPYIAKGARITADMIEMCKSTYRNGEVLPKSPLITMGVDVGHRVLYFHIDEWFLPSELGPSINTNALCRALKIGVVADFYQLEQLLHTYQVVHTIIDVDPSMRQALELAFKYPSNIHLCRFVKTVKRRNIQPESDSEPIIQVNRNIWLDTSQSRYQRGPNQAAGIMLPYNLPEQYTRHITALMKDQRKDDDGNLKSRYISAWDDHYAFARVYSEIALPLAVANKENQDVKNFL